MKKLNFKFSKAAPALLLALLVIPYFSSCGGDDDPPPKSDQKVMSKVKVSVGATDFYPDLHTDGKTWYFTVSLDFLDIYYDLLKTAIVTFDLSDGANSDPKSGDPFDLTSPKDIIVKAEDESEFKYTIAKIDGTSSDAEITAFKLAVGEEEFRGAIDEPNAKVTFNTFPYSMREALTDAIPTFEVSLGANASIQSDVARDCSETFNIVVTAHDQTTRTWTVEIEIEIELSSEAAIISPSLKVGENDFEGETDDENSKVNFTIPYLKKVGLDKAVLTFELSDGATANMDSGDELDFRTPVVITVTAQNNTQRIWTVEVEVQETQIVGRTGTTYHWSLYETNNHATNSSPARMRGDIFKLQSASVGIEWLHDGVTEQSNQNQCFYASVHELRNFTENYGTFPGSAFAGPHLYPQYLTFDMGRTACYSRLKLWYRERTPYYNGWVFYEFEVWGANSVKPVTEVGDGGVMDNLRYWTAWKDEIGATDQWKEGWVKLADCVIQFPSGTPNTSTSVTSAEDIAFVKAGFDFKIDDDKSVEPFRYLRFVLKKQNVPPTIIQWAELEFYGAYTDTE